RRDCPQRQGRVGGRKQHSYRVTEHLQGAGFGLRFKHPAAPEADSPGSLRSSASQTARRPTSLFYLRMVSPNATQVLPSKRARRIALIGVKSSGEVLNLIPGNRSGSCKSL